MPKRLLSLLLAVVFCSGCSVIRIKYTGEAQTQDGKKSLVSYEKTYPVGGALKEFCYISAIFVGGTCWYYLVMPTTAQTKAVQEDALAYTRKTLNSDSVTMQMISAQPADWSEGEIVASITPVNSDAKIMPPLAPAPIKKPEEAAAKPTAPPPPPAAVTPPPAGTTAAPK